MPEGSLSRNADEKKGWEVELGPGHWEALSGRVLSSDASVPWTLEEWMGGWNPGRISPEAIFGLTRENDGFSGDLS